MKFMKIILYYQGSEIVGAKKGKICIKQVKYAKKLFKQYYV